VIMCQFPWPVSVSQIGCLTKPLTICQLSSVNCQLKKVDTKQTFVLQGFADWAQQLNPAATGHWGKMNAQQMVEHVADFFDISSGRLRFEVVIPAEQLPQYRAFIFGDKMFRENTKAPVHILGEEPLPLRLPDMEVAIARLRDSIQAFVDYHADAGHAPTAHPVFGPLTYQEWIQLHHKHLQHHGRQFGWAESVY
jgi:hypothetical protein